MPVSLQLGTEAAAAIERERDCMDYVHDVRCANIWQSLLACKKPPPTPPPPCHLPGGILSPDGVTTSARGKSTRWHPLLFLINKKNHSIHLETATLSQEGIVNISQKMDVLSNCPFVSF